MNLIQKLITTIRNLKIRKRLAQKIQRTKKTAWLSLGQEIDWIRLTIIILIPTILIIGATIIIVYVPTWQNPNNQTAVEPHLHP